MQRKSTLLVLSVIALAFSLVALLTASIILSRPTVGMPLNTGADIVHTASEPGSWAQYGLALAGVAAVLVPRQGLAIARVLAALCVVTGLGLALYLWIPAELMFSRVTPEGPIVIKDGPPGDARIIFLGPWYMASLAHLVLGLAGSAMVLAAVRLRSRPLRAPA